MIGMGDVAPVVQGTSSPLTVAVPIEVFGWVFGVILVAFLVWYMMNRRRV